jgi:hypothetical protein
MISSIFFVRGRGTSLGGFWVTEFWLFVVLVAMVKYDGRMTYWRKALCLALILESVLLVPHFCL